MTETTYTTSYSWDAHRRLVMKVLPDPDGLGTGLPSQAEKYVYDDDGRLTTTGIRIDRHLANNAPPA